eukprot:TRINITY_DN3274_c0_g1_i2.p1 TRINITY_DN3274_c0_g1~~TRINITY_DN3274_c0_g1_i2.p1  ORF type:complete len:261 (+),score=75.54 TRINITY_DN3274_c0_g1_i2:181-963(+)
MVIRAFNEEGRLLQELHAQGFELLTSQSHALSQENLARLACLRYSLRSLGFPEYVSNTLDLSAVRQVVTQLMLSGKQAGSWRTLFARFKAFFSENSIEVTQIKNSNEYAKQIADMFNLMDYDMLVKDVKDVKFDSLGNPMGLSMPFRRFNREAYADADPNNSMFLTDKGRTQVKLGTNKCTARDVKFIGDPDLRPITIFECGMAVRWLHVLSLFIEDKFETRISLRFLASYKNWLLAVICLIGAYIGWWILLTFIGLIFF